MDNRHPTISARPTIRTPAAARSCAGFQPSSARSRRSFSSVPVVGYFFGLRKRAGLLGRPRATVAEFPLNQTRRVNFDNPLRQPWDGVTALTGVYVRNEGQEQRGRGSISRAVGQLRSLGLSGLLVSAVGLVHVPLSRRRLLRRWRARLRSAAARLVSLRVARCKTDNSKSRLRTTRRCKTPSTASPPDVQRRRRPCSIGSKKLATGSTPASASARRCCR